MQPVKATFHARWNTLNMIQRPTSPPQPFTLVTSTTKAPTALDPGRIPRTARKADTLAKHPPGNQFRNYTRACFSSCCCSSCCASQFPWPSSVNKLVDCHMLEARRSTKFSSILVSCHVQSFRWNCFRFWITLSGGFFWSCLCWMERWRSIKGRRITNSTWTDFFSTIRLWRNTEMFPCVLTITDPILNFLRFSTSRILSKYRSSKSLERRVTISGNFSVH